MHMLLHTSTDVLNARKDAKRGNMFVVVQGIVSAATGFLIDRERKLVSVT
jgi:hypothetical protein